MTDPQICLCGHAEDEHDPRLLFCEVLYCTCMCFRLEDDEEDERKPLDFDT